MPRTDLGTIGAASTDFWGAIQPTNAQSAVSLFRFELPQGGNWQLDAQALAAAVGSRLPAALTLFDADGNLLATGTGSLTDVVDPGLVRDLPGGTYYLGVSAAGNLPGTSQGYDPVTGTPGTGGTSDPAGVYDPQVWATPESPSTSLVNLNLNYLDPNANYPTGLDLTFSGPVDTSLLVPNDLVETAVTVVDASGRVWPITTGCNTSDPSDLELPLRRAAAGRHVLGGGARAGRADRPRRPARRRAFW